jgi:hypothetical protein
VDGKNKKWSPQTMNNNFWNGTTKSQNQQARGGLSWKELMNFIASFLFQSILQNGVSYLHQTVRGYSYLKASQETKTVGALVVIPCLFAIVLLVAVFAVTLIVFCVCVVALLACSVFVFLCFSLLLRVFLWVCRSLNTWWRHHSRQAASSATAHAVPGTSTTGTTGASAASHLRGSAKRSPDRRGMKHGYRHTPPVPGNPRRRVYVPVSAAT